MIPGKRYTPETILRILWRRKWFIVIPFLFIAGATVASPVSCRIDIVPRPSCSSCRSRFLRTMFSQR